MSDVERGERIDVYEVIDPRGFLGLLPTARIVTGANVGIAVILTSRDREQLGRNAT